MHYVPVAYCTVCGKGLSSLKASGPICGGEEGARINLRMARYSAFEGDRSDEHFRQKAFRAFGRDVELDELSEEQIAELVSDEKPSWTAGDAKDLISIPSAQKLARKRTKADIDCRTEQWLNASAPELSDELLAQAELQEAVNSLIEKELKKEFSLTAEARMRFVEGCDDPDAKDFQRAIATLMGDASHEAIEFATDEAREKYLQSHSDEDLMFYRDNKRSVGVLLRAFDKDLTRLLKAHEDAETDEERAAIADEIEQLKTRLIDDMRTLRAKWIADKCLKVSLKLDGKLHSLIFAALRKLQNENDEKDKKDKEKNRKEIAETIADRAARDAADRSILQKLLAAPWEPSAMSTASGLSPSKALSQTVPGSADHAAAIARAGVADRLAAAGAGELAKAVSPGHGMTGSTLQGQSAGGFSGIGNATSERDSGEGRSGALDGGSAGSAALGAAAKALREAAEKNDRAARSLGGAAGKLGKSAGKLNKAAKGLSAAAKALAEAAKALRNGKDGKSAGTGVGTGNVASGRTDAKDLAKPEASGSSSSPSTPALSKTSPAGSGGASPGQTGHSSSGSGSKNQGGSGSSSGRGPGLSSSPSSGGEFPTTFILIALLVGAYVVSKFKKEAAISTLAGAIGFAPVKKALVKRVEKGASK